MKKTRIILGIIFLAACLAGGSYVYQKNKKKDTSPPVLSFNEEEITVELDATDKEIAKGVTAYDDVDADVTDSILIESIKKQEGGDNNAFTVTYVAFDKSDNPGRCSRTLYYRDYRKPHFSFTQELRFPENQSLSLFNYIQADDCIDGDVTPFITFAGNDSIPEKPEKGIYDCTVQVTNSVGDTAELTVRVEIYEDGYEERSLKPQIVLKEYLVYQQAGDKLDPADYLDYVNDQGILNTIDISKIRVQSDVDVNKTGTYEVGYFYTSEKTGYSCNTYLTVVVE